MDFVQGFAPIGRADARKLILGSMPSRESLAQQRYYAHRRNAFWPIMVALLGIESVDYDERVRQVLEQRLAIWDVLQTCVRPGSLDSAIDERSLLTNDFRTFFGRHPLIDRIFFNGAKAESMYLRHVLPDLPEPMAAIGRLRLPSTSPANAGMTLEQKTEAWRAILGDSPQ
jgi:hypoxanthine-DNA glycosylase